MARTYGKNNWALFLLILGGIVLGSFLGHITRNIDFLSWLNYGMEFSIGDITSGSFVVDLGILVISFGLRIRITIGSIIGVIAAIIIYKKI